MADANLLNRINGGGEVDTSMLLDTLMYTDALGNENYNGKNVKDIVKSLMKKNLTGEARDAVVSLNTYIDNNPNSDIGNLRLHSCSDQLGADYKGARGAAFYNLDDNGAVKDVYVAFRGTGEGRWYDNGDAFAKEYSEYQQDAAQYFDYVVNDKNLNITSAQNVIATGHSKGGNLAQFITLGSKHGHLIDKCVSFDGQGFSPEAIEYFKKLYGEDFYKKQCEKMYSISGDNDYVNVLGIKVIPEENTVYIKTTCDTYDFENSHALIHTKTGKGNLFDYSTGKFYDTTEKQREMALFAKSLSEEIMKLPRKQREEICRTLMSYLEYMGEVDVGLGGEKATTEEQLAFWSYLYKLAGELILTKEGQDFIDQAIMDFINGKIINNDESVLGDIILLVISPFFKYSFGGALDVLELLIFDFSIKVSIGVKLVKVVYDFCKNLKDSIVKFYKENFDAAYRAAKEYLKNSPVIQLHTNDLRNLADRLLAINARLVVLDDRIDNLYSKVRWTDLWTLMNADFKVCWSVQLLKSAKYLDDTASRFESVEKELLNMIC